MMDMRDEPIFSCEQRREYWLSILPGESGSKVTVSENVRLHDDSDSSSGFTPKDTVGEIRRSKTEQ